MDFLFKYEIKFKRFFLANDTEIEEKNKITHIDRRIKSKTFTKTNMFSAMHEIVNCTGFLL